MMWKNPSQLCEACADSTIHKTTQPLRNMLLKGILAGALIGLAGLSAAIASFSLGSPSAMRLAAGLIFPMGLGVVILLGSELFTGNVLLVVPVLQRRVGVLPMLRNLALVLVGNGVGGALVALAAFSSGQLSYGGNGLAVYLIKTAAAKCALSPGPAFVLGILCNVLVCAGVLLALCAEDVSGKLLGAYVPVALFVICGFEHCVANLFYIPAGLLAVSNPVYLAAAMEQGVAVQSLTWGGFAANLVPVVLGNFAGGALLGAYLWACYGREKNR